MILILDYGSQYTQLLARRIREHSVYSEIHPFDVAAKDLNLKNIQGLILSGGPHGVYQDEAPALPEWFQELDCPVLGICYGAQLLAHALGGKVGASDKREYGAAKLEISRTHPLFQGISEEQRHTVWMSHGDKIEALPSNFEALAKSENSPFAAFASSDQSRIGLQFHPEVSHSDIGSQIIHNFLFEICKAKADWSMHDFADAEIQRIKERVGDRQVICALSGGVDSSVVALILHRAIGEQLTSVFVDHGLLRAGERTQVETDLKEAFEMNLKVVNAKDKFLKALKGVEDPEQKRKIIGKCFVDVFEAEAKKIKNAAFLAQGTLYPDVIESVAQRGPSQTIKTHHNVGGLPDNLNFQLIEPLRHLFKDEVRVLGRSLGLPEKFISRHPFPGPGLAIRILGAVHETGIQKIRAADAIFIEELRKAGLYDQVWQALAVLLPVESVGVVGDQRSYHQVCALRAVTSEDGMTAKHAPLPHEFLEQVAGRIVNEVDGIGRVVYDITSKPPGTIEWE